MWPLNGKEIFEVIAKKSYTGKILQSLTIHNASSDSRKIELGDLFIAIEGEKFDGHAYLEDCFKKGISLALVNKKSKYVKELYIRYKERCICVENVLDSYRELAGYFRERFTFPVIGVGGSNGKTTTKEMIASLLSGGNYKVTKTDKSENGYLGMAITLCQRSHNVMSTPHALVLEIGIDNIGVMAKHLALGKPNISILTALGPEHLEHLKNWKTAAKEELVLFSDTQAKRVWQFADKLIVNKFKSIKSKQLLINDYVVIEKRQLEQNKIFKKQILSKVEKVISWDIVKGSSSESDIKFEILTKKEKCYVNENLIFSIPLPGVHNAANFALSFATALMAHRTPREIRKGFEIFSPPPMRSRVVTLKNGTVLFDDSYNASPLSMEAALKSIQNKEWNDRQKYLILGDMLDLGAQSVYWHENLFSQLKNLQQTYLCLYGESMYNCYKLLKETEDALEKQNGLRIFWLSPEKDPSEFLQLAKVDLTKCVVLVKGSRGMKLDRVVKVIESQGNK